MENQRQVMQKFMSGVGALRKGNLVVALTDLTQSVTLVPDNPACFAKAMEARVAADIMIAVSAFQRIGMMLGDDAVPETQWCLRTASELVDANVAGKTTFWLDS